MNNKFLALLIFVSIACSNSTTSYTPSEGLPEGAALTEYDNVPGLQRAIYSQGDQITEEGDVLNGQKHGTWISYYPTGKIQTVTSYLNGKKQGPEIQFENSGYVVSRAPYSNGELNGEYRAYSRGIIVERKTYENGELNGVVQKYYSTGSIMEESYYVDGVIDGEARWYDQNGNVTIKYVYDRGKLVDDGSSD